MTSQEIPGSNGRAAAAVLASGIGSLALGLLTTLAQAISSIKNALIFYLPVGPLSGKTTIAVAVWLVAWAALSHTWKNRQLDFSKVFMVTLVMIALGLLGTFPLFFEQFVG